jgi:hypothetical protein
MEHFYIGLHQPSDARHVARCCIHIQRLAMRIKPLGCAALLLDSQAFRVLELHGDHQLSPVQYAQAIQRACQLCPDVVAVTQDYMCEQYIFDCRERLTGRRYTIAEHQQQTIERYDAIRAALDPSIELMPVLQGYQPAEYRQHILDYGARLAPGAWVGVGSVCKRNGDPNAIRDVLHVISSARHDLRLHGFGVKLTSLASPTVRRLLYSADSMAWSYSARKQGRNGNDYREAIAFARRCAGEYLGDLPMFQEIA